MLVLQAVNMNHAGMFNELVDTLALAAACVALGVHQRGPAAGGGGREAAAVGGQPRRADAAASAVTATAAAPAEAQGADMILLHSALRHALKNEIAHPRGVAAVCSDCNKTHPKGQGRGSF